MILVRNIKNLTQFYNINTVLSNEKTHDIIDVPLAADS